MIGFKQQKQTLQKRRRGGGHMVISAGDGWGAEFEVLPLSLLCWCQLRVANSSLTDRSSQLTALHKDVELKRSACDTLEENLQHEKVSTACLRRFRLSFCYFRRGGCAFTGVSCLFVCLFVC